MDLSVIVPVYGSQDSLRPLAQRLMGTLGAEDLEYEVIFINDDSPDDSWSVLQGIHADYSDRVTIIQLTRNFGQHNAVMCGFRHSSGAVVVTMDDDLQHPPEEIPNLLSTLHEEELDVVYGRYAEKKHAGWRNMGSNMLNLVFRRVFGVSIRFTSLRAIRREIAEAALDYDLNFAFIDGLLAWNTTRIGEIVVPHAERMDGKSGYSLSKLMLLSVNMLTNFSLFPLRAATLLGLVTSVGGLVVGLYYLLRSIAGDIEVPGYASLITAILFIGGAQLLAIGVIGEYLGRVHLNVNRKPQYRERCVQPHRRGVEFSARDSDPHLETE